MRNLLKPSGIRLFSTILAITLALPFSWKALTGLFTWLSPYIMLNSVFVLKSVALLNILGFIVLCISFYRKRWFCRYLCPVGWGCDMISRYGKQRNFRYNRMPAFGSWLALFSLAAALTGIPVFMLLDPMSIFHGFFSIFSTDFSMVMLLTFSGLPLLLISNFAFPGFWCSKICPLGGLQDTITSMKNWIIHLKPENKTATVSENSTARRFFIVSGMGFIAGIFITRMLQLNPEQHIRPPASVPAKLFNTLCIRCGNCIKACPTKIIVHHTSLVNLIAWMTPEISFQNGYCLEECNLCSRVCPSGAITSFSVEAKKQLVMGTAVIDLENCLLTHSSECNRCLTSCSYNAMEIVPVEGTILMIPVVDVGKCVGCGACSAICPPEVIKISLPISISS